MVKYVEFINFVGKPMAQNVIFDEGLRRLKIGVKPRIIDHLELSPNLSDNMIIEIVMNFLNEKHRINLFEYTRKSGKKVTKKGDMMNWHCDDCAIIRHNGKTDHPLNNIKISDKFSLYHREHLPIYSLLIYLSSVDIDFTGGSLEFVDGTKVIPVIGDIVLFDSREVHRLTPIKSGNRICILTKFYDN